MDDGERQYADGLNELTSNEALLNDGAAQLADAEAQLKDAEAQLQAGRTNLPPTPPSWSQARKQLEEGQAQYEAGLKQYNDGLAQIETAEKQLADAKAQLDANADTYQQGIAAIAEKLGVDAAQVDAFIGWLAQNCDANGTQPPQTVEELWQAIQNYGGLTIPAGLTQEQVDAIRAQATICWQPSMKSPQTPCRKNNSSACRRPGRISPPWLCCRPCRHGERLCRMLSIGRVSSPPTAR